ncbi:MAG: DUF2945 domain-containing protein [Hyphomicrobiales bacterium]|nr:MAG: DUF2945 domain-containing protein [Hyphomicrobiales bacterium]
MTDPLRKGTAVRWNWGSGTAEGKVEEVFTRPVSRTIKGKRIRRNGSQEKPAYLVKQEDGDRVLKSHGELKSDR